jgi:hypothetical protein
MDDTSCGMSIHGMKSPAPNGNALAVLVEPINAIAELLRRVGRVLHVDLDFEVGPRGVVQDHPHDMKDSLQFGCDNEAFVRSGWPLGSDALALAAGNGLLFGRARLLRRRLSRRRRRKCWAAQRSHLPK